MTAIPLPIARAMWMERQGLDEVTRWAQPVGGWLRSIGGVAPYLSMRLREPSLDRGDVDAAFASGALRVVPGVRGCIWTVAEPDAALATRVAAAQSRRRTERDVEKAGGDVDALATLAREVLAALADGPQSTRALAAALPDGAVTSYGAAGKKVGVTTSLPPTLRLLEFEGAVERALEGDRLEGERYLWRVTGAPFAGWSAAPDQAADADALARRYFEWTAIASFDDFVTWSGLNKGPARAAVEAAGVLAAEVEGVGTMLCLPEHAAEAVSGIPMDPSHVCFLPTLDNLLTLRARPGQLFASPDDQDREVMAMGNKRVRIGDARWMTQRPLFVGGRWAGLWDWDRERGEVVWGAFGAVPAHVEDAADAEAAALGAFIRDALGGEAKAHSIDGEASQRKRVAAVAALRG